MKKLLRDDGTGLTLLGARYYDEAVGQFISVDPLLDPGVPAHFNAYVYSYNNPTTFSDPSGARPAPEEKRAKTATTAQTAPPPTSFAALQECKDLWCAFGWGNSFHAQFSLGVLEGIGQLAYEAVKPFCGACQLVETGIEVYEMVSDWDGYVARKTDELQTAVGLITGDSETWQEAVIDPIVYSWETNPGNFAGKTAVDIAAVAVPGGVAIKGLNAARNVAAGAAVNVDRAAISATINLDKQARHLEGTSVGGGFFASATEAQSVLNAFHDGSATVLGVTKSNQIVVRVPGVTGFNNNVGAGYLKQPTNVFFIKGQKSVSVVPANPNWKP